MKILSAIESGFYKSLKSWKSIMIVWLFLLILVSIFTVPLKGALKTAFGGSMITGNLSDGFNPEVFSDLGSLFKSIVSFTASGFMFILLLGFVAGAFLTGGLFCSIKKDKIHFSAPEFFSAAAKNFFPFLVISLAVVLVAGCVITAFSVATFSIIESVKESAEETSFIIGASGAAIILLIMPVLLLIADYSRAWKAGNDDISGFRALGFGFSQTFRKFWPSYLLMLLMILIQLLLGFAALKLFLSWNPAKPGTVFLFFLISQLSVIVRILFKTWRYASVTAFMEEDLDRSMMI